MMIDTNGVGRLVAECGLPDDPNGGITVPGVFLSYRRNDSAGWAGRIRDHLALRYGQDRVWQDVEDLTVGSDYLPPILKNIAAADAVLIVIGPHWLEKGRGGTTGLDDPKDVLRTEIVHALKRKSGVIPTLVGGASMPDAKNLPRPVAPLVKRNGIAIVDADWARSMQLLFDKLQDLSRASAATKRRVATLDETLARLDAFQSGYFAQSRPIPPPLPQPRARRLPCSMTRCRTTPMTRRFSCSEDSS
jgi:hypothetical protein